MSIIAAPVSVGSSDHIVSDTPGEGSPEDSPEGGPDLGGGSEKTAVVGGGGGGGGEVVMEHGSSVWSRGK